MAKMLIAVQIKDKHYVYRIDRSQTPLGRGATAVVYKGNYDGELIDGAGVKKIQEKGGCPLGDIVAIKMAHKNTPPHLLIEFNAEKEILRELKESLLKT